MFKKDQQQQRDLFESERNFRLLVEGVTDYALYLLDPAGIITSWNIGGHRIKGYAPEEIIGQHFSRFYTEVDRSNGKPYRALQTAREQGRYEEDGWRVRKDGTFFWASVVIDAPATEAAATWTLHSMVQRGRRTPRPSLAHSGGRHRTPGRGSSSPSD